MLLFPAAVIVVFLLAAVAVDSAAMFQAHRSARRAAEQAADDAAAIIDLDRYESDGIIALDPDRARAVALASLSAANVAGRLVGTPEIVVDPDAATVSVAVTIEVRRILLDVADGGSPQRLRVSASARLEVEP